MPFLLFSFRVVFLQFRNKICGYLYGFRFAIHFVYAANSVEKQAFDFGVEYSVILVHAILHFYFFLSLTTYQSIWRRKRYTTCKSSFVIFSSHLNHPPKMQRICLTRVKIITENLRFWDITYCVVLSDSPSPHNVVALQVYPMSWYINHKPIWILQILWW